MRLPLHIPRTARALALAARYGAAIALLTIVASSCASRGDGDSGTTQGGQQSAEYIPYASLTADSCLDTCQFAFDEVCDEPNFCATGTDCSDCGGTPTTPEIREDECVDTCRYAGDGTCDVPYLCATGTDCTDCNGRGETCNDKCQWSRDGECDAPGSCEPGTDCTDCKGPFDGEKRVALVVVGDMACDGALLYKNGGRVESLEVTESLESVPTKCSETHGYVVDLEENESATIELRGAGCQYVHQQAPLDGGTCAVVCLGCER
jgi:hypothetical protein